MPRDRANIRTDIWGDADWNDLTPGAQWLYQFLLTSPTLSYVGVADWRPKRIAKKARALTAEMVERYGRELADRRFIIVDDETEEVFVRSFLRHDGLMQNPNLWKSVGLAFTDVASPAIGRCVAAEVQRLRAEYPEGFPMARGGGRVSPWASAYLRTLLDTPADTPTHTPTDTPTDTGSPTTTPTPTPRNASHSSTREKSKSREMPLPKDWAPTADHIERARALGVDVMSEAENFRLHAEAHDRKAAVWNSAFTMWLKKAKPVIAQPLARVDDVRDGFLFRQGKPVIGGPNGMTRAQYDEWADAQRAKAVRRA